MRFTQPIVYILDFIAPGKKKIPAFGTVSFISTSVRPTIQDVVANSIHENLIFHPNELLIRFFYIRSIRIYNRNQFDIHNSCRFDCHKCDCAAHNS